MKKLTIIMLLLCIAGAVVFYVYKIEDGQIEKANDFHAAATEFSDVIETRFKSSDIKLYVDNEVMSGLKYKVFFDDEFILYASLDFFRDILGCSISRYVPSVYVIRRGDTRVVMDASQKSVRIDNEEAQPMDGNVVSRSGEIFIPVDQIIESLNYRVDYSFAKCRIDFVSEKKESPLPARYDMREDNRVTPVRDQGKYGTCWAVASLGALETTLMPYEKNIYSIDHLILNNSYNLDLSEGGEHNMTLAYLASWQGPVFEKDDIYGDGKTNPDLKAVKHLEEAVIIEERDDEKLKGAIYRYAGVETSMYLEMTYENDKSEYYNSSNAAYYYPEKTAPNHDVVVIGWDDNYPRENFNNRPVSDGAFICKNSWGDDFGDGGYFYVSYEDANICQDSVIYTAIAPSDNFDHIYQSDMLGWVGRLGFNSDSAYFANCYTAGENEELSAVSFYATGNNTEFTAYVVRNFEDTSSFSNKVMVASGGMRYPGYYTVRLNDPVKLSTGERFAVVVYVKTEGTDRPIAIEYRADEKSEGADLEDGEGYMSLFGAEWYSAEQDQNCNICLKAFTNDAVDD